LADGYGYSRFCDLYRDWRKTVSATMRQTHAAGEKLFVDWAGDTVPVFDAATGMERRAHIFVAVLGASNYTYAEGRWSEALPEWIGAHVNAFAAIGGVPGAVVCDNLKAGVTATCRYEPGINRTYQDLATHYDTAILPTRPRKPRDKAKVEVGVLIIERYVLARLRNRRFFSLFELNVAIPVMGTALLESIRLLANSTRLLADTTIDGLHANVDRARAMAESSPSIVTPLNKIVGYENAAKIAKHAVAEGMTIRESAIDLGFVERGELTEQQLDAALDVLSMTHPG